MVHSAVFISPDQAVFIAADLALDKEFVYQFNPVKKQPLSGAKDSMGPFSQGASAGHGILVFHLLTLCVPDGRTPSDGGCFYFTAATDA